MFSPGTLSLYIITLVVLTVIIFVYMRVYLLSNSFTLQGKALFNTVKSGPLLNNDLTLCAQGLEPTCYGQNPSSPYTSVQFIPTPPQSHLRVQIQASLFKFASTSSLFVISGLSPPPCQYWGFTLYMFNDPNKCNGDTLFASLTDTVNNISTSIKYNKPFTIVFGCNKQVIQQYLDTQNTLGTVITVPFPYPGESANLLLVGRTALFFSYEDKVRYNTNTNIQGRVIQYNGIYSTDLDVAEPFLKTRTSAVNELDKQTEYDLQANAFIQSVQAAVGSEYTNIKEIPTSFYLDSIEYDSGYDCINACTNCMGDNRDAVYTLSSVPVPLISNRNIIVVFGVNHSTTDNAVYTNLSVYNNDNDTGLVSFDYYKDPLTYGLVIAKEDLNVPSSLSDSYVVPADINNILIVERAYSQPQVAVSAKPSEIYKPRVWVLSKQ